MVAKAHQRANTILRCFVSRDVNLLLNAFIVYVRPILEYNSVIWSPSLIKDIDCVERVQRRFTKRLPGLKNYSYGERLTLLGLQTLELRRLHIDLIMCYKIVFGLMDIRFNDFFCLSPSTRTRGHPYKLYKNGHSKKAKNIFFTERIVNNWNFLPADKVDFSSVTCFKRTIDMLDFAVFLKCH